VAKVKQFWQLCGGIFTVTHFWVQPEIGSYVLLCLSPTYVACIRVVQSIYALPESMKTSNSVASHCTFRFKGVPLLTSGVGHR